MFNWGQIWTECWPIEWVYVSVGKKLLANSGDMGPGIILGQAIKYELHILCTRRFFFVLAYINFSNSK
jgi:hypothetical protein